VDGTRFLYKGKNGIVMDNNNEISLQDITMKCREGYLLEIKMDFSKVFSL
jgi:hypothetical protein